MSDLINGRTQEEIKHVAKWNCYSCGGLECDDCSYLDACTVENRDRAVPDALALIERLESERDAARAKVPKWISVKERLPEEAGKYIVCTRKNAVYCTAFRFFHGKGYFATDTTTHITHWMPMPEPQKEDTNGHQTD